MWWWEALLVGLLRVDEYGCEFLDLFLSGGGETAAIGLISRHDVRSMRVSQEGLIEWHALVYGWKRWMRSGWWIEFRKRNVTLNWLGASAAHRQGLMTKL